MFLFFFLEIRFLIQIICLLVVFLERASFLDSICVSFLFAYF